MCSKGLIQSCVLLAATIAATIATPRDVAAQAAKFVADFTATTVGLNPGAGETLKIDVLRWSTDEEVQKLLAAFKEKGEKQWNEALQATPSVGYVWARAESLGYAVRMAQHSTTPDGGESVALVTDRPLGSWERQAWKATGPSAVEYPFSVIELHVARTGMGEGKASLAAKVAVDEGRKASGLENYAVAPVLLTGVKRLADTAAATTAASKPVTRKAAAAKAAPKTTAPKEPGATAPAPKAAPAPKSGETPKKDSGATPK